MKKTLILICIFVPMSVISCKTTPKKDEQRINKERPPAPTEELLWSSHTTRPDWILKEQESSKDEMYFVGLSGNYAMESDARDDAMRNARKNIIEYMGTLAKERFQSIKTTHGLSSDIIDPTNITRNFQDHLSQAMTKKVRAKEWYMEKWQNNKMDKIYWKSYVLARIPNDAIAEAFVSAAEDQAKKMKDAYEKAKNEKAKQQFKDAMEAFKQAADQGFK